jgi:molybdate transport system substrate-binding protein
MRPASRRWPVVSLTPSAATAGLGLLCATLLLAACTSLAAEGAGTADPTSAVRGASLPRGEVLVFAAASLGDVLKDLEAGWLADHPQVSLRTATDASNVLATQIAEGADADVFLSADLSRPMELATAGLTAGQPHVFARSRLTIVVPQDDDSLASVTDIARPGVRLVAAGPGVPVTRYAQDVIAQLAASQPDPSAFVRAVEANVVSREDNVRAALAKVELGEGDAAIVYVPDARASALVRELALPPSVDVTAEYAAVQISADPAAAALVGWLAEPEAAAILTEAGFEPLAP